MHYSIGSMAPSSVMPKTLRGTSSRKSSMNSLSLPCLADTQRIRPQMRMAANIHLKVFFIVISLFVYSYVKNEGAIV